MASNQNPPKPLDMQAKGGFFDRMEITISKSAAFRADESFLIRRGWKPELYAPKDERNFNWMLRAKDALLRITESYPETYDHGYTAYIELDQSSYTVLKSDDLDAEGNPTDTFTMQFALLGSKNFKVQAKGGALAIPALRQANERRWTDLFIMSLNKGVIEKECRYIQVKIPDFKKEVVTKRIDTSNIIHILTNRSGLDPGFSPAAYCTDLRKALSHECAAADAKKSTLERARVYVTLTRTPHLENRLTLTLKSTIPNDAWGLEGQEVLQLQTIDGEKGGIFASDPTPTPGHAQGRGWQAKTLIKNDEFLAVVDNQLSREQVNEALQTPVLFLHVSVDMSDPLADRSSRAITMGQKIMNKELGITEPRASTSSGDEDDLRKYRLPLNPFFLQRPARELPSDIAPIPLSNGRNIYSEQQTMARYELTAPAHQKAIRMVYENNRGWAIIQGPPATGKTTVVSKILLFGAYHYDVPGKLVCAAHTNEATRVACQRTVSLCRTMFGGKPEDLIVLVLTKAKSEYYKLSEHELGGLEQYTLEAHFNRIVATNPGQWTAYRAGVEQIKKFGRIEDKQLRGKHDKQRQVLVQQVYAKCKIFFTTLATCHVRHELFGDHSRRWSLLMIDEASQATDLNVLQAIVAIAPERVGEGGDQQQLDPHLLTDVGRSIMGRSLFEKLIRKNCPFVMLNVQYRTIREIYAGTAAHYNQPIDTDPSTAGRSWMGNGALTQRVYFRDNKDQLFSFLDNDHVRFFNLVDTACVEIGITKSSANVKEFQFIAAMMAAFNQAQINMAGIMCLTGYNGQHLLLERLESEYAGLRARKIDSSQGGEADMVIFSMTRTTASGLGFLRQVRRQNVGTSRARNHFYLAGDLRLIDDAGDSWGKWWRAVQRGNGGKNIITTVHLPVKFFCGGEEVPLPALADVSMAGNPVITRAQRQASGGQRQVSGGQASGGQASGGRAASSPQAAPQGGGIQSPSGVQRVIISGSQPHSQSPSHQTSPSQPLHTGRQSNLPTHGRASSMSLVRSISQLGLARVSSQPLNINTTPLETPPSQGPTVSRSTPRSNASDNRQNRAAGMTAMDIHTITASAPSGGLPRSGSTHSNLGGALTHPPSRASISTTQTPAQTAHLPAAQRPIQHLTTIGDIKAWINARPENERKPATSFYIPMYHASRRGDKIMWNWQKVLLQQTNASPDMILAVDKCSQLRMDGDMTENQITQHLKGLHPSERNAVIPHFNAMWQADMNGNQQARQAAQNALENNRNVSAETRKVVLQQIDLGCPPGMMKQRVWLQKWFAARPQPEKDRAMPYFNRMNKAYMVDRAAWDTAKAELDKDQFVSEYMRFVVGQLARKDLD